MDKREIKKAVEKYTAKGLQRLLNDHTDCHLVVDGIIGRKTFRCLSSFATLNDLVTLVLSALRKNDQNPFSYIEKIAVKEIGVHEWGGMTSNPKILQYHKAAELNWKGITEKTPWCGSFAAWVMKRAGFKPPHFPARAMSWLKFGRKINHATYGSIAVKKRKGGGHVTFVIGRDPKRFDHVLCLGGNQGDAVSVHSYPENVFLEFRLPEGVPVVELNEIGVDPLKADNDCNGNIKED